MAEESKVGFVTMAAAGGGDDVPEIGVGMLGYAFMGKAHANGYRKLAYMTWPPPLRPRLVSIAGRSEDAVAEAARRYGFDRYVTDWTELVSDPGITLFDNSGPNNLHAEPSIAAAEAGKHVICEKPLARTADESYDVWQRVQAAGVKHMCAFNYRFVRPAARARAARGGRPGRDPPLPRRVPAGVGRHRRRGLALRPLARRPGCPGRPRHARDRPRPLPRRRGRGWRGRRRRSRRTRRRRRVRGRGRVRERRRRHARGVALCPGRKNAFTWEINGSKGSIAFDLERLNELEVHLVGSKPGSGRGLPPRARLGGRPPVLGALVAPRPHHRLGAHVRAELHHFLTAIRDDGDVAPHGATFEDGYRALRGLRRDRAVGRQRTREQVTYR